MIRSRYVQKNLFESLLSPLDMPVDPELEAIDRILDEDESILDEVKAAFSKRRLHSRDRGRPSTPVEVIVRLLLLKHLYGWSYEQTVKAVRDSFVLRRFCRIYLENVPHDTVLIRWAQFLPDELLKSVHRKIVHLARQHRVTRGRKLRVDTTVVETNIHYPSDSRLLEDGVKVLGRVGRRVRDAGIAGGTLVRSFTRSVKRRVVRIAKYARGRGERAEESFRTGYRELIEITQKAIRTSKMLKRTVMNRARYRGEGAVKVAGQVKRQLERFIPLLERVVEQTKRRVLKGETVSNSEKIISLHHPHSYVIRKGKAHKPNEFGQVTKIQEADGGIITDYESYCRQPRDSDLFIGSIQTHTDLFGRAPYLATGDRGFASEKNEEEAYRLGVKRVCLPKRGRKSTEREKLERSRWFRRGQRFRAGSEGRISVLKRRHRLDRCLYKGHAGLKRWVGLGVIASNLLVMARAT